MRGEQWNWIRKVKKYIKKVKEYMLRSEMSIYNGVNDCITRWVSTQDTLQDMACTSDLIIFIFGGYNIWF